MRDTLILSGRKEICQRRIQLLLEFHIFVYFWLIQTITHYTDGEGPHLIAFYF